MDETAVVTLERCPLCDGSQFRALPVPGHWIGEAVFGPYRGRLGLCQCSRCSFRFTNPRPGSALLGQFYGGDDYSCHRHDGSDGASHPADFLLTLLAQNVPAAAGKRLLDFGCGGGGFLNRAAHAGWDAVGFDVGQRSLKTCTERGLRATDRLADLPAASFDVITLNHVFEHLDAPGAVLASLRALLAPQGKLLVAVPNCRSLRARLSFPVLSRHCRFDERFRAFPIHLSYFTRPTLKAMLRRHDFAVEWAITAGFGLEELRYRPETAPGPPPARADAAGGTDGRRGQPLQQGARRVIKRVFFGLGLGENLLALARPAPQK
jgi:SAM-dependent methyltransferase